MLNVDKINVYYDNFQALHEVTFSMNDRQTLCLVGPNGHGKSTILKTISGALKPKSGKITFGDSDITGVPSHELVKRGIVYVPEGSRLFPNMTVLENLKLGAYTPKAWKLYRQSLELVFDLFPRLENKKSQLCWTLSGGERRMTSIGRGLMSNAKLLMLDEPSLGLAPKLTMEVYQTIKRIKSTGVNLMIVEQNVNYVSEVADRVYLIEEGRVSLEGSFQEFIANPRVTEVYLGR